MGSDIIIMENRKEGENTNSAINLREMIAYI